ncbi:MAG: EamA family transporter [Rhodothermales bacterium]
MKGAGYIVLAAVLWGLLGPVARLAFDEGVAPFEVAFWRAVIAGVLFVGHAAVVRTGGVARRDLPGIVGFGIVGVSVFFASYQLAVEAGGAALASVLLYTAPAWVAVLSVVVLRERMTALKGVAVALTLAGVAGITLGGGGSVRWSAAALGWGLVAGFSYSLYYLVGKHYFMRYGTAAVLAVALPLGALGLAPFVDFAPKSAVAWAALGAIGLVSTYGAFLAYARGVRTMEATRASVVATLEPVVAAAVAYAWWGERFSLWGYAGAALILAAVLVAVLDPAPRRP